MRLLIDTHVALWAISNDPKLSSAARGQIIAAEAITVSAVTIWEIAIKYALRRGRHDDIVVSGNDALRDFVSAGYELLSITPAHAAALDDLPPLHGDPFDRMLIAQAMTERMNLMTHDARMKDYGALVIAV